MYEAKVLRIIEAQKFVEETVRKYGVKRSVLASLAGVLEELGELSSKILISEKFKRGTIRHGEVGYCFAKVLFELLKLADACNIDLEREWTEAIEEWRRQEPHWL